MSQEDVEVLRRLYAEWAKGDLWALRDIAEPDMEWEWSAGLASVSGGMAGRSHPSGSCLLRGQPRPASANP
jgi:ketosteroid isomerase-like protein